MLDFFYTKKHIAPAWNNLKSQGYPDEEQFPATEAPYQLMAGLPAILRTLLITDGTVTRSLEAYFWEPIRIQQVSIATAHAQKTIPWLKAETNENLLTREVQLVGKYSNTTYAAAYSIIRLDKVPSNIREQLTQGGIGIGVLISQFSVESYREILELGHCKDLSFHQQALTSTDNHNIAYRSYRIMVEKNPTILITEKFPIMAYQ